MRKFSVRWWITEAELDRRRKLIGQFATYNEDPLLVKRYLADCLSRAVTEFQSFLQHANPRT